jgi:hypothetical protein
MAAVFATDPDQLTVEQLNAVVADLTPGVAITGYELVEMHEWGGGRASTGGRMVIDAAYAPGAPNDLPRRLVLKMAKPTADRVATTGVIYRNEVDVYSRLRPWTYLEAPRVLGAAFEAETATFLLIMEDLRERGATFGMANLPVSLDQVRFLIEQLARLHARYWASPQLDGALGWMEAHTRGRIHDVFTHPSGLPAAARHAVETIQFKREMVERMGATADSLFDEFVRLQKHQARLPQTVCHGDTHIANTYLLPGEKGGLLDWQLSSKGFCLHDVTYLIATALSVGDRRAHERELLAFYRDRLRAHGVAEPPSAEQLWLEHRRAIVWGVYIGWLAVPVANYGLEITVMNHLRVMTAYEDLECSKALEGVG